MKIFSSLDRKQKEAIGLLQIGTFLEYFDLMLYVHMAVLLNELFFPKTDPQTARILAAVAFCSTFLFRPFGALLFGYIGDRIGRRATVIITTFMMALTSLTMAVLPTYAQIGIAASWIITLCRVAQGLSSLGEIIGAELYLTETVKPPAQYPIVGLVGLSAVFGSLVALSVAALATSWGFNWRIAFVFGAGIALVGAFARNRLRETPEFADAKQRIQKAFAKTSVNIETLNKNPLYTQAVSKKTALSFFLIQCSWPVVFYFTYVYCSSILKSSFDYTPQQIIIHNLQLALVHLIRKILKCYLSIYIHPLRILKGMLIVFSCLALTAPYFLSNVQTPTGLLLLQAPIVLFGLGDVPAVPILFKYFPVFKRFTYASFLYAMSRALVYVVTSFGLVYLTNYLGNWGILGIMGPMIIGYGFALLHFEKLERMSQGRPVGPIVA